MEKKKEPTIEEEIMMLKQMKDFGLLSSILRKLNDKIDKLHEEFDDYDPNQDIDINHGFESLRNDIDTLTSDLELTSGNLNILEGRVDDCESNISRFDEELTRLEGEIEEIKPFVDAFNEM